MGDVMRESATLAYTYAKAFLAKTDPDVKFFEQVKRILVLACVAPFFRAHIPHNKNICVECRAYAYSRRCNAKGWSERRCHNGHRSPLVGTQQTGQSVCRFLAC
jgi:hypothetical protein